jgi:RNA polymerase sigma-70 factor (ECF subfamily)
MRSVKGSSTLATDDYALARRVRAGEREAFETYFALYFPRLYRFVLYRSQHNADLAQEVAQAVMCKSMEKLEQYRGEASLFTWLCTICRHELADHTRLTGRIAASIDHAADLPEVRVALESLSATSDAPELLAQREQMKELVATILDYLPPRYSQVLEYKYIHEQSVREISERMAVSEKALESLLCRARAAFRDGFLAIAAERNHA